MVDPQKECTCVITRAENLEAWKKALSYYPNALSAREKLPRKDGLKSLDEFAFTELDKLVKSRDPPYITKEEYCKLITWKLKRGKWRPRLQKFANETEDSGIRKATSEAFLLLEKKEIKKAIQALVAVRGCGPATASAILSAVDHSVPFMSDELLISVFESADKYTVKVYLELVSAVEEKVSKLTEEDPDREWTARDVEHAVYASVHCPELEREQHSKESLLKSRDNTSQFPEQISADQRKDPLEDGYSVSPKVSSGRKDSSLRPLKNMAPKRKLNDDSKAVPARLSDKQSVSSVRRSKRIRQ